MTRIYHINKQNITIYCLCWQHQNSLQTLTLTTETICDVEQCMEYPIAWKFIGSVTNILPSDPINCVLSEHQHNHGGYDNHPELPTVRSEECRPANSDDFGLLYENVCPESKFFNTN